MRPLYQKIAVLLDAVSTCRKRGNLAWLTVHSEELSRLIEEKMPQASGFDTGLSVRANSNRIEFIVSFRHVDGWTEHFVIVTPSLADGFNLRVTGHDRDNIKAHIHECFDACLRADISEWVMTRNETAA